MDLTRIDGIDVTTALAVISETATYMSRFPSGKTKRRANRATQALRPAAAALRTSQSALDAYFRRMCSRMDKPKAVIAAAHKLARLIYTMLIKGEEYTDQGHREDRSRR